jgi:hypothetical protein
MPHQVNWISENIGHDLLVRCKLSVVMYFVNLQEFQILLALFWLATDASVLVLADDYGVGQQTVFRIKRAFVLAVLRYGKDTLNPDSPHWLGLELERRVPLNRQKFLLFADSVAAADGSHFPLLTSRTGPTWTNRKGIPALNSKEFLPQTVLPSVRSLLSPDRPPG